MIPALNILALAAALAAAYVLMSGHGLPAPVAGLPLAMRGVIAIAVLALGIRGFTACGFKRPAIRAKLRVRRRGWLDVAAAIGVWIALHAAFLWLIGVTPRPIERLGLAVEPWLRPEQAEKRKDLDADAEADGRSGNWLWQDLRSRSLPPRTNLRPGNRPEAFVRFTNPADAAALISRHAYLSSFALSKYDQGRWTTPTTNAAEIPPSDEGNTSLATAPARSGFPLIPHEIFHGANADGQNVLTALQGVEIAAIAPVVEYDDGFVILPDEAATSLGFRYAAQSRPLAIADLPPDLRVTPPDDTADWLAARPPNPRVATHLEEVAREILGETPTVASLVLLEQWFQNAYDYSLQTFNPDGLDPLENFLFAERTGHCEHFAMAAALMLRTVGLPTRVAYGWNGGTWYESAELLVFRSREAHAWTEILLPGFGWVILDPTPPSGIGGNRSRIAPPDETPPDPDEPIETWADAIDHTRIDMAAAWMFGIFGLPTLALLTLRARARANPARRMAFPAADTPGVGAGGYLTAWFGACPPHHHGETLRQQIRNMECPPPFAANLIEYHYRIRYSHETRDPRTERQLERDIRKWHQARKSKHSKE